MEIAKMESKPEETDNKELIQKRKRSKTNYKKINNETRQKLIEMDAAKFLGINYSTAKTILRIFRIEKRIEKKNADEERVLKSIIFKYQNEKKEKNELFENIKRQDNAAAADSNFKLKSRNDGQLSSKQENDSSWEEKTNFDSPLNTISNLNKSADLSLSMEFLIKKLYDLNYTLNGCNHQIRNNQIIINNLFSYINQIKIENIIWPVNNNESNFIPLVSSYSSGLKNLFANTGLINLNNSFRFSSK